MFGELITHPTLKRISIHEREEKNWGCHDFKEGKIPFSNERELIKILNISVVVDAKSLSTREKISDKRKH